MSLKYHKLLFATSYYDANVSLVQLAPDLRYCSSAYRETEVAIYQFVGVAKISQELKITESDLLKTIEGEKINAGKR